MLAGELKKLLEEVDDILPVDVGFEYYNHSEEKWKAKKWECEQVVYSNDGKRLFIADMGFREYNL